jgi:Holliday junction resolvasome RuvABC endonuclease subunit
VTVGIDLDSRSIAISVVVGDRYPAAHVERIVTPRHITERAAILRYLRDELEHHYSYFRDQRVFVEAPVLAGARNIQSTIKVAGVYGLTLATVGSWSPIIETPISTWKKHTVGTGNATKDQVAAWLKANHPEKSIQCMGDQNLVDATCIALYGLHHQLVGDAFVGEMDV